MEQSNTTSGAGSTEHGMMETVRDRATAQVSQQKNRATEGLGSVARAVRQAAQPLRDNQQNMIAEYVEKAADQLERYSTTLRDKDMRELMDDAQRLARRQPALFIGAAFAAGLLGARFLKSSADRRRESLQRYDAPRARGTGYAGATGYAGGGM